MMIADWGVWRRTLSVDRVTVVGGGGSFCCVLAMGAALGFGIFFSRLLAAYLFTKALGVCLIEAAVT